MVRGGYIYIITNKNRTTLYVGVTSNLRQRTYEHKTGVHKQSFSKRYNLKYLVYYEGFSNIEEAIHREKQLKSGNRQRKLDLIDGFNPEWIDLYDGLEVE